MPRIEITAAEWTQRIDGNRFIRRHGDVCDVTEAEAKRLVSIRAAQRTKKKVTVDDQKAKAASSPKDEDPLDDLTGDGDDQEQEPPAPTKPADTATEKLWQAYAINMGMEEAKAHSMSRDELRAFYADK